MKISNRSFAIFACLFCLLFAVAGCSPKKSANLKDVIIGNWQVSDEKSTIEFKADGTLSGTDGGETESGTYKLIDDHRLQMVINLTSNGAPPAQGTPASLSIAVEVKVVDNDNLDVIVSMPDPTGKAQPVSRNVHFTRIK